jgi:methenyltetrahydrofolate cyclohydrolase
MSTVKDSSIEAFLDDLASQKSTPGGGSAAGVIGAMSAALVSMMCNLTIGKPKYREVEQELRSVLDRAETLRREMIGLIEADVRAFDAVMAAYGMPRGTEGEAASRAGAIQEALQGATSVPMRCCRASRELIDLGVVAAEKGNRNVVSDAGAAVLAGYAALRCSALNVFVNAKAITDRGFVEATLAEVHQLLSDAAALTERTYEAVKDKLGK